MTLKVYHILVCHAVRTDKEERTVYAPGCVQLCCCSWAARGLRGGGGTCYNVRRAETRTIYHERNN